MKHKFMASGTLGRKLLGSIALAGMLMAPLGMASATTYDADLTGDSKSIGDALTTSDWNEVVGTIDTLSYDDVAHVLSVKTGDDFDVVDSLTAGDMASDAFVTAGTYITATTGDITASAGDFYKTNNNFSENNILADADGVYAALEKLDLSWGNLASTNNGEGAAMVGVADTAGNFSSSNVEGSLAELSSLVSDNALLSGLDDSSVHVAASVVANSTLSFDGSSSKWVDNANFKVDADGVYTAATGSTVGNLMLANGSITDSSGDISFNDENLITSGTLGAGAATVTSLTVGSVLLSSTGASDGASLVGYDPTSPLSSTTVAAALDELTGLVDNNSTLSGLDDTTVPAAASVVANSTLVFDGTAWDDNANFKVTPGGVAIATVSVTANGTKLDSSGVSSDTSITVGSAGSTVTLDGFTGVSVTASDSGSITLDAMGADNVTAGYVQLGDTNGGTYLDLNRQRITNTAVNGDISIVPNGTGVISVSGATSYEANVTDDDDIPNKRYVDNVAGALAFTDLTDTPGSYATEYALHRVGIGATALEETTVTLTYTGSNDLTLTNGTTALAMSADANITAQLDVDAATDINSTVNVDGVVNIDNALTVQGDTSITAATTIAGATTVVSGSTVNVDTNATVDIDAGMNIDGQLNVESDSAINQDLTTDSTTVTFANLTLGSTLNTATGFAALLGVDAATITNSTATTVQGALVDLSNAIDTGTTSYNTTGDSIVTVTDGTGTVMSQAMDVSWDPSVDVTLNSNSLTEVASVDLDGDATPTPGGSCTNPGEIVYYFDAAASTPGDFLGCSATGAGTDSTWGTADDVKTWLYLSIFSTE